MDGHYPNLMMIRSFPKSTVICEYVEEAFLDRPIVRQSKIGRLMFTNPPPLGFFQVQIFGGTYSDELVIFSTQSRAINGTIGS
jgi:hypothetical protein